MVRIRLGFVIERAARRNSLLYRFCFKRSEAISCSGQDPFLSRWGKKRFLDSKERQPEEVSSGLLAEAGSLRAEPKSPLSEWGVPWVRRGPLPLRLTSDESRTTHGAAARRLYTRQRRKRKRSLPRKQCGNVSFLRPDDRNARYPREKGLDLANDTRVSAPFSFLHRARRYLSFRARPKRKIGGRIP